MNFIADFHIHSHFSRATSRLLTPEYLDAWAAAKGIGVMGTGDFTHPGWLAELEEKLVPEEPGLFTLKPGLRLKPELVPRPQNHPATRFCLTGEISTIYKQDGRVRKVHHLIFTPDFNHARAIQHALIRINANITSDGRPIIGLDSRTLLDIILTVSEENMLVPAHIWTPWFSVLGDKSGFDNIESCYGDLSRYIRAVETGLSSDPPMNRLCGFLDRFTLISNSDAHSPEKLGREANLFDTDLSYGSIMQAISNGRSPGFLGTVEFFPQEGKYHFDGHRKCAIRWDPTQTFKENGICPVCGKRVTIGVMNRVLQLADRKTELPDPSRPSFHSVIPLKEIISEILGVGLAAKRVDEQYRHLLKTLGTEFDILMRLPLDQIRARADDRLADAIGSMRQGKVQIDEGFDGRFGRIRVLKYAEKPSSSPGPAGIPDEKGPPGQETTDGIQRKLFEDA